MFRLAEKKKCSSVGPGPASATQPSCSLGGSLSSSSQTDMHGTHLRNLKMPFLIHCVTCGPEVLISSESRVTVIVFGTVLWGTVRQLLWLCCLNTTLLSFPI